MSFHSKSSPAHAEFLRRITDTGAGWWDAIVLTASHARQAERYREEIATRLSAARLPHGPRYLVVPDPELRQLGSGSATILALAALMESLPAAEREGFWKRSRVLLIHSGGDSRRMPQHSAQGKLFGVLPGEGTETTSVFDETMAHSTAWLDRMGPGVLVMSGDVVVEFDAAAAEWSRAGVTGVGMRLPLEVARQHGVYVADGEGRVYTVLQKPTLEELKAAGGVLEDGRAAVDTGLLRFDPEVAARLTELAEFKSLPAVDLYDTILKALTGQWQAGSKVSDSGKSPQGVFWRALESGLRGTPFFCNVVDGQFTHVGTTEHFRKAAAGGVMESVLGEGSKLGADCVVVECWLPGGVRAGQGSILHGLHGLTGLVEVPENTVLHQVQVLTEDGRRGTVIRAYGVDDDPKVTGSAATWFGRSVLELAQELGITADEVWPGVPAEERALWNARLFPMGTVEEAWRFARWVCRLTDEPLAEEWRRTERHSLESSAQLADGKALLEAQDQRMRAHWQKAAIALAKAETDLRPMLAHAPGIAAVAATGRALREYAETLTAAAPTQAASRAMQAGQVLRKAGLTDEAEAAEDVAMGWVTEAVERGVGARRELNSSQCEGVLFGEGRTVVVSAPARIDLGGGWSDTPPFCLDWGGTVLNLALEVGGGNPIRCTVKRLAERVMRCVSEETGEIMEWSAADQLKEPPTPGSTAAIPRAALQLLGIAERWHEMQGGLEIRTAVRLPLGSGLGTSSILAATVVQALAEMQGRRLTERALLDAVMRLEQMMTTGGGWQDQAGGIFPGAKLLMTGPGLEQRIRVRPLEWPEARKAEFAQLLVLCDTGIQRMAKNLLRQVVGNYLAREAATVQVLHSIKTLAVEMAYAMAEGEWVYLGQLLNRHWALNIQMDPHTTNGPIEALLERVKPWTAGAKLAGAGGGGFLILLAKGPEEALRLKAELGVRAVEWRISETGLLVEMGRD